MPRDYSVVGQQHSLTWFLAGSTWLYRPWVNNAEPVVERALRPCRRSMKPDVRARLVGLLGASQDYVVFAV